MMNFNPHDLRATQAQSNGGAIAALTRQGAEQLNLLGAATSKAGQDIRGQNLSALLAGKEAQAMDSTQLQALAMSEAGGSINPAVQKDIAAMVGLKAKEEASLLANENALEKMGIQINSQQSIADARNATSTANNKASNDTSKANTKARIHGQQVLRKMADDTSAKRQAAQPFASAGGNLIYDKRTGKLTTLERSSNGKPITGAEVKSFEHKLTGNQKKYFADLSDGQKSQMMEIRQWNPKFNITPITYTDSKGIQRHDGYEANDGTGFKGTLEDIYAKMKRFQQHEEAVANHMTPAELIHAQNHTYRPNKIDKLLKEKSVDEMYGM